MSSLPLDPSTGESLAVPSASAPSSIKRKRYENEEPTQRVAQCTKTAQEREEDVEEEVEEMSKKTIIKKLLEDLQSSSKKTLTQAMKWLANYIYDDDDPRMKEKVEGIRSWKSMLQGPCTSK